MKRDRMWGMRDLIGARQEPCPTVILDLPGRRVLLQAGISCRTSLARPTQQVMGAACWTQRRAVQLTDCGCTALNLKAEQQLRPTYLPQREVCKTANHWGHNRADADRPKDRAESPNKPLMRRVKADECRLLEGMAPMNLPAVIAILEGTEACAPNRAERIPNGSHKAQVNRAFHRRDSLPAVD